MTTEPPPLDVEQILSALARHGVELLLVGGVAAIADGVRLTVDLDRVPVRTCESLDRLAAALRDLNARLRVAGLSDAEPTGTGGPNGTIEGGMSCPSPQSCTAVGQWSPSPANGDFLARADGWDGANCSVQLAVSPVGAQLQHPAAVACPTPRVCVAVGESTGFNSPTNTRGRPTAIAERSGAGNQ